MMRLRKLAAIAFGVAMAATSFGFGGCTKEPPGSEAKEAVETPAPVPGPPAVGPAPDPVPPAPGQPPAPPPVAPENCYVPSKLTGELPFYVPGKGVVLTRMMKPCTTATGQAGYDKDTPYLAMGFPCTGGAGRVDIKGTNYHAPKMISFILATDCPMSPSTTEAVKKTVTEAAGLAPGMKLMAFTPFAVQYWEIPGMTDADAGFSVDLRSAPAIEGAWKKLQTKDSLRVRFYGRENAWVQGGHFYMVDGDLRLTGRTQFQLEVAAVKALTKEEIAEVKARCDGLKPARNCSEVF